MKFKQYIGNRILFYFLFAILGIFTSCNKFLEEEPFSFISPENFYNNGDEAQAAVFSIYDQLSQQNLYSRQYLILMDGPTDIGRKPSHGSSNSSNLRPVYPNRVVEWNSGWSMPNNMWNILYEIIDRSNTAIANIPDVEMDAAEKASLLGEAKFLRGLAYFELVRMFGPVPLRTEPGTLDTEIIPRSSVDEVYEVIIADFKEAAATLPLASERNDGRATSGAAYGYLGKALLTFKKPNEALDALDAVIESGEYDLFDDFYKNFIGEYEIGTPGNREHLFSVKHDLTVPNQTTNVVFFYGAPSFRGGGVSFNFPLLIIDRAFANKIPDHYRKEVSIPRYILGNDLDEDGVLDTVRSIRYGGYPQHAKHLFQRDLSPFRLGNNGGIDIPLLRYADILLLKAEAINEINGPNQEAIDLVNQVRKRARTTFDTDIWRNSPGTNQGEDEEALPDLKVVDFDQQSFREALIFERGMELMGEGHRRMDLIRLGFYNQEFLENIPDFDPEMHMLFAIPQREMDLHKGIWTQNNGY